MHVSFYKANVKIPRFLWDGGHEEWAVKSLQANMLYSFFIHNHIPLHVYLSLVDKHKSPIYIQDWKFISLKIFQDWKLSLLLDQQKCARAL